MKSRTLLGMLMAGLGCPLFLVSLAGLISGQWDTSGESGGVDLTWLAVLGILQGALLISRAYELLKQPDK